MTTILRKLQDWYQSQCNGYWEHGESIMIRTLDNPGWAVFINIKDTALENRPVKSSKIDRSETDWLYCGVSEGKYTIYCGAQNLEEGISCFLDWANETGIE